MILKRATDRYNKIKTDQRRLTHLHGKFDDKHAQAIQQKNFTNGCDQMGANLLDRAYGHNQTIALLHDLTLEPGQDRVDHILIDALTAEIIIISTQHLGAVIKQSVGNKWHANYGGNRIAMEDPSQRLNRQISQVKHIIGTKLAVIGLAIMPIDARYEVGNNDQIQLIRSDHFESFIAKRRGDFSNNHKIRLAPDDVQLIANQLITADTRNHAVQPTQRAEILTTEHGNINIKAFPGGQFTVRNDPNPQLINSVRHLLNGEGRWNPKYRNWTVSAKMMGKIREYFMNKPKS